MSFQQRAMKAFDLVMKAIRDGNLNRNVFGVHAVVVTYPHELNAQRAFHYAVECNQPAIAKFLYMIFGQNELNPSLRVYCVPTFLFFLSFHAAPHQVGRVGPDSNEDQDPRIRR